MSMDANMKLLEIVNWNKAVEIITLYDWIIDQGKTLDDLREEVRLEGEEIARQEQNALKEYVEKRRKLKDQGLDDDWCEACDMPLLAIESPSPDCEAELKCPKCTYSRCLDISLTDYRLSVNEKMYSNEDLMIKPGENRVSIEERKRRRKICMACEHLTGNRCRRCGCTIKHRTYYEILSCPDKRW